MHVRQSVRDITSAQVETLSCTFTWIRLCCVLTGQREGSGPRCRSLFIAFPDIEARLCPGLKITLVHGQVHTWYLYERFAFKVGRGKRYISVSWYKPQALNSVSFTCDPFVVESKCFFFFAARRRAAVAAASGRRTER